MSDNVRAAVVRIVESTQDPALTAQLAGAHVTATPVETILDVVVPEDAAASAVPDGPLGRSGEVMDADGELQAEVVVFVESGRLSSVELLWYGDGDATWPDADRLTLA